MRLEFVSESNRINFDSIRVYSPQFSPFQVYFWQTTCKPMQTCIGECHSNREHASWHEKGDLKSVVKHGGSVKTVTSTKNIAEPLSDRFTLHASLACVNILVWHCQRRDCPCLKQLYFLVRHLWYSGGQHIYWEVYRVQLDSDQIMVHVQWTKLFEAVACFVSLQFRESKGRSCTAELFGHDGGVCTTLPG